MSHDLELAIKNALQQMPKEDAEAIIQKALNPPPVGPYKATANILFYSNPIGYHPGWRARFSYKCEAGNTHEDIAHQLWIGENYLSETRNISCDCQEAPTPVEFLHPNNQHER